MKRIIPLFIFAFSLNALLAQFQIGQELVGETFTDMLGLSVSLDNDGNCLALGAPTAWDSIHRRGAVRLYRWADTAWVKYGSDIRADSIWEAFGMSVSLSENGERVAIGSTNGFDTIGTRPGLVKIMEWDGSAWGQVGNTLFGDTGGDNFGSSVSISEDGNRVAIAALRHASLATRGGQVKVFDWDGAAWVQAGGDFLGTESYGDLGTSISLSKDGERLAISAMGQDSGQTFNTGRVWVYEWQANNWVLMGNYISGYMANHYLGRSVALSEDGTTLAVSAATNTYFSLFNGLVSAYRWNGNSWVQIGNDILGPPFLTHFGQSVTISGDGDLIGIGAMNSYGIGESFLRKWDGNDWRPVGFPLPGESYFDSTGYAVALSTDGSRFAVGSPNDYITGWGIAMGAARVYGLRPYLQEGYVFQDLNNNCLVDGTEPPLKDVWVKLGKDTSTWEIQVQEDGYFGVFLDTGRYSLFKGDETYPYHSFCPAIQYIEVDTSLSSFPPLDIPVKDSILCPLIEVKIEQEPQYYCYPGKYLIQYKNTGTIDAHQAEIDLILPEPHIFTSSSIPPQSSNGQLFTFSIDTIRVGQEGSFTVNVVDNCQYQIGNSFCAEVYARPDSLCLGSMSNIRVEKECLGPKDLRFIITNLGDSILEPLPAYVFYGATPDLRDTLALLPMQPDTIDYHIRFSTPHKYQLVIAPETPKYYTVTPLTTCGSNAWLCCITYEPTFPQAYQDAVCRYSPQPGIVYSSMEVSPQGTGPQHLVDPDSTLSYTIQFFNRTRDSVQRIEIIDTLASELDTSSFELGAMSHAFQFSFLPSTADGKTVISFVADSLNIPPQFQDQVNSKGFVSFKLKMETGLPLGTQVVNYAHVHFEGVKLSFTNAVYVQPFVCRMASAIEIINGCGAHIWRDGQRYVKDTLGPSILLTSPQGCDSILTLDLTLTKPDTTLIKIGDTLWVVEQGASYQWFRCDSTLEPVLGATSRRFVPPDNGNYRVRVSYNQCSSFSACEYIRLANNVSVMNDLQQMTIFPNPTSGHINIDFGQSRRGIKLELFNLLGEKIREEKMGDGRHFTWKIAQAQGIYLLKISSQDGLSFSEKIIIP